MKESMFKLLDLQVIDKEIDALRRSRQEYPDEIERLQGELGEAESKIQEKRQRAEELEKSRRSLELELEAINQDMKLHQDRLNEVKTNKEYDALQHEIEALRNRIEEHETAILEAIEESEDLVQKLEDDEAIFGEMKSEGLGRINELQSRLDSVEENVRVWEKKRGVVESEIDRRPLSIYSRIQRVVRGGIAVVPIEKAACGGCFRQLSPQRLMEIRRQDQIIRCENCGRILVWNEEVKV